MTHAHTQESLYKRRHLTFFSSSNFTPMTLYSRKFGYKWWDEDKCPDEAARKEQTDLSCSTIKYSVGLDIYKMFNVLYSALEDFKHQSWKDIGIRTHDAATTWWAAD